MVGMMSNLADITHDMADKAHTVHARTHSSNKAEEGEWDEDAKRRDFSAIQIQRVARGKQVRTAVDVCIYV